MRRADYDVGEARDSGRDKYSDLTIAVAAEARRVGAADIDRGHIIVNERDALAVAGTTREGGSHCGLEVAAIDRDGDNAAARGPGRVIAAIHAGYRRDRLARDGQGHR